MRRQVGPIASGPAGGEIEALRLRRAMRAEPLQQGQEFHRRLLLVGALDRARVVAALYDGRAMNAP